MARILHITTTLRTGGAEMNLLRHLSARRGDSEPTVLSLQDEGTLGARISALGIPVYALGMRRAAPNPLHICSLRRLVRRLCPQLIQGWMYHANLMGTLAEILPSGQRVPVLWRIASSLSDLSGERRLTVAIIRLSAFLSWQPAGIIYCSQASAQQHEAIGYRVARRCVIPNGFDCDVFRPDPDARREVRSELGVGSETILVGLVARYHPLKDHTNFLRAAGLVARLRPEVSFLLIGNGVTRQEPELMKAVVEQGLEQRVFLLGERSDMPRLTAALDIACSASRSEAFSTAIGEAMASGVPCVATDVGDSSYIIEATGLLVPARNPEALGGAIARLVEAGAAHRQQMGSAARRRIESQFSLAATVRSYEELYQQLLAAPRRL